MKRTLIAIIFVISITKDIYSQTQDDWNMFRLAQSYESLANYEKAFEIYRDLYSRYPSQFQFYDAYYRMLSQLKRYDEAIALLKKRLNNTPNDFNLYGELAVLYERKGIKDSTFYFIHQGINVDPKNPMGYKFIANILIQNRLFEYANDVLEEGKLKIPDNDMFIIDLININTILMNYPKATDEMIYLLKRQPQQIAFVQNKLAQMINNPVALKIAINTFEKNLDKKHFPIIKILSWLYFQNKDFKKAFEITLDIEKLINANGYELLEFSNRAYQEEFYDEAVKGYEYILKNYQGKKDLEAMSIIGLARSYEQLLESDLESPDVFWKTYKLSADTNNKNLRESLKYYEIIYSNYTLPNLVAEALYKSALFYKKHFKNLVKAKDLLNKVINDYVLTEFYTKSLLLAGDIEKITGNYGKAIDYYDRVRIFSRATETERNTGRFQMAEILIHRGLIDSAKSILTSIKKVTSDDLTNDAIEFLMIINEQQDSPLLKKYMEIDNLIENLEYEEAIKMITSINFDDDYSLLQHRLRFILAELYITLNKYSEALVNLSYLYELKDKSIYSDKALYRIGQLYFYGLNDKNRSEQTLTKLLTEFPNSIFANEVREMIKKIQLENF